MIIALKKKIKKRVCLLGALSVITIGGALLGAGICFYEILQTHTAPSPSSVIGHRNDTILLRGDVDSFSYSSVTVWQCTSPDAYHNINIYIRSGDDVILKPVPIASGLPKVYQDSGSYKLGIQDYLYLVKDSNFNYNVCLASSTNYNQSAAYFLFRGKDSYDKYVNSPDKGETESIYAKHLIVQQNNQTNCNEIAYTVSETAYYFMLVRSPGSIFYSYNFTLTKTPQMLKSIAT